MTWKANRPDADVRYGAPRSISANGWGGQYLLAIPAHDLVVVRLRAVEEDEPGNLFADVNSIVVYLTFFSPKGVLCRLALATVPDWDVAIVSLVITLFAVVTPLIFHRLVRDTPLAFLYVRPAALRLVPARQPLPPASSSHTGNRVALPPVLAEQAAAPPTRP
jgi:hypothetical protein